MTANAHRNPVTEGALLKRINRRLRHENEVMKVERSWSSDFGWYWIFNWDANGPIATNCDPEKVGRELGVLRKDEFMPRPR
jgi:hypothetical protein